MLRPAVGFGAIFIVSGGIWLLQNLRQLSDSTETGKSSDPAIEVASPESDRASLQAILAQQLKQISPQTNDDWPDKVRAEQLLILKRFNSGDYGATLELARKNLDDKSMPETFRIWLRDQMAAILVSLGWLEIKQEKCEQALLRFEEADRYSQLPESLKGAGFCRYQLKDAASAASLMRQYLENSTADQTVRILYADALESLGRFREAAQALESITPGADIPITQAELSKRVKSMRAKISEGDEQSVMQFNQFTITYRPDLHDELIPLVTETLDNAVQDYVDGFGFSLPRNNIEVVLYEAKNFQQVVSYGPEWAQGIFDGRMRIPIADPKIEPNRNDSLKRVLRHELSHALISEMLAQRTLPTWFSEGLAQRMECNGECGVFPFPSRKTSMLGQAILEASFNSLEAPVARQAYLQSLYLVLVLEHSMGIEGALRRVVSGLGSQAYTTSDQILNPIGLKFSSLYAHAEKLWNSHAGFEAKDN